MISPQSNHDSNEGEQWGRYNLPRYSICCLQTVERSSIIQRSTMNAVPTAGCLSLYWNDP